MSYSRKSFTFILIITSFLAASLANAAGVGNNIAVRLVGTYNQYDGTDLFDDFGIDQPIGDPPKCFDLDLVDVKTGNVIGAATDCLTDINVVEVDAAGPNAALVGTTFFHFDGGTVIARGLTTVQPVLHGSPNFTHITGAIPGLAQNGVIYGDGKFKNAAGPARLSGAVDLTNWTGADGTPMTFDCVFILDLK